MNCYSLTNYNKVTYFWMKNLSASNGLKIKTDNYNFNSTLFTRTSGKDKLPPPNTIFVAKCSIEPIISHKNCLNKICRALFEIDFYQIIISIFDIASRKYIFQGNILLSNGVKNGISWMKMLRNTIAFNHDYFPENSFHSLIENPWLKNLLPRFQKGNSRSKIYF